MKKRLRKKRRIGEFREDCFEITIRFDPSLNFEELDAVSDEFISMIENNGLQFGGGGNATWTGIVEGPWRGTVTAADREKVLAWLHAHPKVVDVSAGPLRDAWYGWE